MTNLLKYIQITTHGAEKKASTATSVLKKEKCLTKQRDKKKEEVTVLQEGNTYPFFRG